MSLRSHSESHDQLHTLREALDQERDRNACLTRELGQLREQVREAERYRFLFETMEEGFCIIQFIAGADGRWVDYHHLMANPAYCRHAGLPDVVGRTLREVIPDEADIWLERFGHVARTGEPIYFEHELYATNRYLGLAAIRVEPAEHHQVAVIFRDVTARKRAEMALQVLNTQLEQRIEQALAERKVFADLIDASVACVQVVDRQMRWQAINAATRVEFQRIFAFQPEIVAPLSVEFAAATDDCQRSLALWRRALAGEAFMTIEAFGQGDGRRHYEMRFAPCSVAATIPLAPICSPTTSRNESRSNNVWRTPSTPCAKRRRWKPWGSSPAVSPMTSTTCSAAYSARLTWPGNACSSNVTTLCPRCWAMPRTRRNVPPRWYIVCWHFPGNRPCCPSQRR